MVWLADVMDHHVGPPVPHVRIAKVQYVNAVQGRGQSRSERLTGSSRVDELET